LYLVPFSLKNFLHRAAMIGCVRDELQAKHIQEGASDGQTQLLQKFPLGSKETSVYRPRSSGVNLETITHCHLQSLRHPTAQISLESGPKRSEGSRSALNGSSLELSVPKEKRTRRRTRRWNLPFPRVLRLKLCEDSSGRAGIAGWMI
jgi:hypothetical protein